MKINMWPDWLRFMHPKRYYYLINFSASCVKGCFEPNIRLVQNGASVKEVLSHIHNMTNLNKETLEFTNRECFLFTGLGTYPHKSSEGLVVVRNKSLKDRYGHDISNAGLTALEIRYRMGGARQNEY